MNAPEKVNATDDLIKRIADAVVDRLTANGLVAQPLREVEMGPIKVLPDAGIVSVSGREIRLQPHEYKVLIQLLRHRPGTVSRDRLMDLIGSNAESVRSIDVIVRRLRVKLGDAGKMIRTMHGFGYRIGSP